MVFILSYLVIISRHNNCRTNLRQILMPWIESEQTKLMQRARTIRWCFTPSRHDSLFRDLVSHLNFLVETNRQQFLKTGWLDTVTNYLKIYLGGEWLTKAILRTGQYVCQLYFFLSVCVHLLFFVLSICPNKSEQKETVVYPPEYNPCWTGSVQPWRCAGFKVSPCCQTFAFLCLTSN